MCRVSVLFDQSGHAYHIRTHYCGNHPACYTLKGELIRPLASAPAAGSTVSNFAHRASSLFPNYHAPVHPSGGGSGSVRAASAAGPSTTTASPGTTTASPLRRAVSGPSPLRQGLARLTSTADRPQYVPFARDFCIMLRFVYKCGHDVNMSPPPGGWVCSKAGCRHTRHSHTITVPLEFSCAWAKKCDSKTQRRRAILREVATEKGTPPEPPIKEHGDDMPTPYDANEETGK